ncbi:MAG TPA: hypothetical protein VJN70_14450, partial [Gemmatimonadaceae bacterium]|nr:hypothetical protein [Gemmatimonadaceae bacterium]
MSARLAPRVCLSVMVTMLLAPVARSGGQTAPTDRLLIASDEPGNRVVVVSLATGQVEGTIPVGNRPRGMAISPDGQRIFVALGN